MSPLILAFVFGGLLLYYLLRDTRDPRAPPGPRPLPLLGNLLDISRASKNPAECFGELSKKYGEIFSLQIGTKPTVILASREAIETVMTHEASHGRDNTAMFYDRSFGGKKLGIAVNDGPVWERTRPWAFKILREYGFGKAELMDSYLQDGMENLFQTIDDKIVKNKGIVSMDLFFAPTIFTVMWRTMFTHLTTDDEKDIALICEKSAKMAGSGLFGAGLVAAFPILRYIFPDYTGYNIQIDFFNTCNAVAKKILDQTISRIQQVGGVSSNPNLVEAFAQNMIDGTDDSTFFEQNFQLTFQDLMLGSTETTNSFMEAVVLFLTLYPDAQEKIFNEIQKAAPNRKFLTYADKKGMPYTEAFLLEVHRLTGVLPNLVPRRALADFTYKKYLIKKDTVILPDQVIENKNENTWEYPKVFKPERFINESGQVYGEKKLMTFGFGRRTCPGEVHAKIMSFVFLTALVQRYTIKIPQGMQRPREDMNMAFSNRPFRYETCFTKRY